MGEPERLKLDLLGRFALTEDGTRARQIRISAPKGRALLAYCAMRRGQGVSRDTLATLLWGDRYDKQARQSLRQCLLRLRANLGARADLVVLDGDEVTLRTDAVVVDAIEFTALAESNELADLERAAALYRGPFLADVILDVEAFDEWARSEQERLEAIATRVFAACAERHDSLRHGRQAVDAAEKLVALDPLREDYQRRQLTLYARYRGREAALAHAKALVGLLKRELDAEPEPATRALIDDIKRGAIAPQESLANRASAEGPTGVSEPSASMTGRPLAPRAAAFLASRVGMSSLALAGALAMVAIALFGREWSKPPDPPAPSIAIAPAEKATTDESWRPPSVLPGAAVDQAAFAARGLIPLAVLPFRTYGDDGTDQEIAEQITDDLINDLSRTPSLRVISGHTSRLYGGRPIDVAAIGAELGVRYVIAGGVRTEGELLRINVDLVDTANRLHAWSDRFERAKADRFAMLNEITRGLARRLQFEIADVEARRTAPGSSEPATINLAAKGWTAIWRGHSLGSMAEAEVVFEELLKKDPDNPSGLIGLASFHLIAAGNLFVSDRDRYLARAEQLLVRAREKYPNSSLVHYNTGLLHKLRGKADAALSHFTKSLELYPSHAPSHAQIGSTLIRLDRPGEALDHIRYAIRLSPKDPGLPVWTRFAGQAELERGHDEAALEWFRQSVVLGPTQPWTHAALASVRALNGDMGAAIAHVADIRKFAPWAVDQMKEDIARRSAKPSRPSRFWDGLQKALAASP